MTMLLRVGSEIYEANMPGTGNKSYGNKNTNSDMKDILVTFSKGISPTANKNAYTKAKNAQEKMKSDIGTQLHSLVDKLTSEEITANQFKNSARKLFKKAYEKAFETGASATGLNIAYFKLPSEDYRWLDKIRKEEYKYLEKFIQDMANGKGSMDYHDRLDMYIATFDAVFEAGRVDAMPSAGTKIHWIMHPAEHCPDCISLASNSPYEQLTLPTTPKAGDTKCLSNCKCTIRVAYEAPQELAIEIGKYKDTRGYTNKEAVDWNAIDKLMSIMMEEVLTKQQFTEQYFDHMNLLTEEFCESIDKVNIDIDPYSRDFVLLHRLGAMIRDSQIYGDGCAQVIGKEGAE